MALVQDGNQCIANIVDKYDIKDEVKDLLNKVFSDEWIQTVEFGNSDDFNEELAVAIDPLTNKMLSISG